MHLIVIPSVVVVYRKNVVIELPLVDPISILVFPGPIVCTGEYGIHSASYISMIAYFHPAGALIVIVLFVVMPESANGFIAAADDIICSFCRIDDDTT